MAVRLLLVALAVVAGAVAIHGLRADHRCKQLETDANRAPARELGAIARVAADRCGDPRDAAVIAAVIAFRENRAAATDLARRMTAEHPDDYLGWLVLYRLTGDRHALGRVRALDPRGAPR